MIKESKETVNLQQLDNCKILIVEDEFLLGERAKTLLNGAGFMHIEHAMAYQEAITQIQNFKPDIVLLDIQLGDNYDGLLLAKELRYTFAVPFIFTSSHTGEKVLKEAKQYQPYGYLVKPLNKVSLAVSIEMALYKAAYESVSQQERDKVLLLELSNLFARIRNKEKLFDILFNDLKHRFGFDDAVITIPYQNSPNKLQVYAIDTHISYQGNESFKKVMSQNFEKPPHFVKIYDLQSPELFTVEDYETLSPNFAGVELMKEVGLKATWAAALQYGGNLIGSLEFHYKTKEEADKVNPTLFSSVANQMSIAVSNILANEEILERQKEKETLLSISERVTKIRNNSDLMQVIFEKMQPLFDFDDCVVILWNNNGAQFRMLSSDKSAEAAKQKEYDFFLSGFHETKNTPYETIYEQEELTFFSLDYWLKEFPNFPGIKLIDKVGYVEHLVIPLWYKEKKIGVLEFHSKIDGKLKNKSFDLYRGIAGQVALAVSNILANEDILERQKEKETLLSFSEDISKERDKIGLISIINKKMREIFGFDYSVIIVNSKDKTYHKQWFVEVDEKLKKSEQLDEIMEVTLSTADTPFEWILELKTPSFFTAEDLKSHPNFPGTKLYWEMGMKKSLVLPLYQGGQQIGVMLFHYANPEIANTTNLSLAENTANQIAVAVSNILANEEILERQKEKETLLDISENIATIRERDQLFQTILSKLSPFISFQDAVVIGIDKKKNTYSHLMTMHNSKIGYYPLFDEVVHTTNPFKKSALEHIYKLGDFGYWNVKDWEKAYPEFLGFQLLKENKLYHSISFHLKQGGQTFAIFMFYLNKPYEIPENQHDFFLNVVNQISTAVSNILANETLIKKEQLKGLQAEVSQAITVKPSWDERFEAISIALKKHVPFDYISFALDTKGAYGKGFGYEKIGFDEYRKMDATQFFEHSKMTLEDYEASRKANDYKKVAIYNDKDFKILLKKDKVKRALSEMLHLKSNINIPLLLSHEGQFQISLYNKLENGYTQNHLDTMEQLLPSFIHPIEKVLAYEQVERLNEMLKHEKDYLQEEIRVKYNFDEIVGSSKELQEMFLKVNQVAISDTTVLITGETGTGKELIARAIHNVSKRNDKPLIKLNCATLPAQLLESELFGHERGAFTGAQERRIGKFELADNGTIFLDEIGELPIELQSKLLRVIQEKEFERLGGNTVIKSDFRLIAATNRDLQKSVSKGEFRSDLFFRLNVFPIELPALRERKEDIPALATHFLHKTSVKLGKKIKGISSGSLRELMAYDWPGNVRELEHVIERSVLLTNGLTLKVFLDKKSVENDTSTSNIFRIKTIKDAERELILNTLQFCGGRVRGAGGASELLDINPATLDSRMKKLGIEKAHIFKK